MLLLISCKDSEVVVDYSQLNVSFVTTKMDVGENTKFLEIPIELKGVPNDMILEVNTELSTTDDTALTGVDFELLDKTLTFNNCGKMVARVRIIDNNVILNEPKCFNVNLKSITNGVKTVQSTIKIYIINDDAKSVDIIGNYTFKAEELINGARYSSAVGGVNIEKDAANPTKYYIRNLILENGKSIFPLTYADDLYFIEKTPGKYSMPSKQVIGDYGKGEGYFMKLNSAGYTLDEEIELKVIGNKLYFVGDGFAGATQDATKKIIPYYLYKRMILEKITN